MPYPGLVQRIQGLDAADVSATRAGPRSVLNSPDYSERIVAPASSPGCSYRCRVDGVVVFKLEETDDGAEVPGEDHGVGPDRDLRIVRLVDVVPVAYPRQVTSRSPLADGLSRPRAPS